MGLDSARLAASKARSDKVPHHSTFSVNRLGRFRESERHIFERLVATCMAAGLIKGEGFAVGASVMETNAQPLSGQAPADLDWTDAQPQKRAVAEYLAGLETETQIQEGGNRRDGGSGIPASAPDRKSPKVISPSDPSSAWTAKANKRVQFGYGLNPVADIGIRWCQLFHANQTQSASLAIAR